MQRLRDLFAQCRRNAFEQNDIRASRFQPLRVGNHQLSRVAFASLHTKATRLVH